MNRVSSTERTAKFSGGRPSGGANGVGSGLLHEEPRSHATEVLSFLVLRFPPRAEMGRTSGCEQQPSPKVQETRPPDENHESASFAFYPGIFEGWASAAGLRMSRRLHRGVARTPRWPTEWAENFPRLTTAGRSAGGCRVKPGPGPLVRSLPACFKVGVGSAGAGPNRCERRTVGDKSHAKGMKSCRVFPHC